MPLPTGKELEKKLKAGAKAEAARCEELRRQRERFEETERARKRDTHRKAVEQIKEATVRNIEEAIARGKRRYETRFGENKPGVENAVKELAEENPGYSWDFFKDSARVNNEGEAANVGGVSYREWTEHFWTLKVTW